MLLTPKGQLCLERTFEKLGRLLQSQFLMNLFEICSEDGEMYMFHRDISFFYQCLRKNVMLLEIFQAV